MTFTVAGAEIERGWEKLDARVAAGDRFAGLTAAVRRWPPAGPGARPVLVLSAHLAVADGLDTLDVALPAGAASYPALTPRLGAASWYERIIHDQFGVIPEGHPRLAPLIRPGSLSGQVLPRHVEGYGVFTFPHGPVRSGVTESIEYLIETPGEDIPHLNLRVFYKRRGIAARFEGLAAAGAGGAVLLAERTEGIASVAHALAYCHAVERLAGCTPPVPAGLVRVLHAELERIANHLDVAGRLADAGGLAVAAARFAVHKERVLRLVSRLCGSRFGRGVVVPGGVRAMPELDRAAIVAEAQRLQQAIDSDADSLMATSSFLDRLRTTGPLRPARAREHGALGPIGKASGYSDDARTERPYDAYPALNVPPLRVYSEGDALARLRVRWDEVDQSFALIAQVTGALAGFSGRDGPMLAPCEPPDGRATGWAEAPQGEVLYDVAVAGGRVSWCRPRSASFHNLVLMHEVFAGDILTDFPFIEASFGLSVAGVAQ
jgi:Ni,Fe-hydrogenase III large subunit